MEHHRNSNQLGAKREKNEPGAVKFGAERKNTCIESSVRKTIGYRQM